MTTHRHTCARAPTQLLLLALLGHCAGALAQTAAAQAVVPAASAASAPVAPAPPAAAKPAQSLDRVEITGAQASDSEQRRRSSASKIVIGREEIERQGDSSVSEIVKRLPGVTLGGRPGRGGEIRMRGLGGGYTQILINGERAPMGFSFDNLTPDLIERIEVLRAPTAETGARAIAGTINIILREDVKKRLNVVKLALGHEDHGAQPSASWSRAEQIEAFSYNLNANLSSGERDTRSHTRTRRWTTPAGSQTSSLALDQLDTGGSHEHRHNANLGGRAQWRLGPGETLALVPFVVLSRSDSRSDGQRSLLAGSPVTNFERSETDSQGRFSLGRLNALWQNRWASGLRSELRSGLSSARWQGDTDRREYTAGNLSRTTLENSTVDDRWWTLGGKANLTLASGHALAAGAESDLGRRRQSSNADGSSAGDNLDDNLDARTLRTAVWAQDEWDIDAHWAVHGGLRWEAIRTRSDWVGGQVDNRSSVFSPLLHAVWRPVEGGRDQLRASLTRSYRAPSLQNLVARRSSSRAYPTTGPNEATSPDRIGNPDLKPELATGLDLAFEHYLAEGGLLSVSVFHRRIAGLIRNVTSLQTVDWAAVPRWVSQPRNVGNASTQGIELEAKFGLKEVLGADAPALDLRSNLSLFRSRVEGVPGPDNRIDQQPGWTANLGADHRLRGSPLTLGANLNLTPAYQVQQSASQSSSQDAKRVLDAYALWSFNPAVKLRLSASNIVTRDYDSSSEVSVSDTGGSSRTLAESSSRSSMGWRLQLEFKL
jgi:iron complex outermembrane receptor protein